MARSDLSWPTPPPGVRSAHPIDDPSLLRLEAALRDYREDEWFDQVQPPENPGPFSSQNPDYDHSEDLAAVPDSPTEEYRLKAHRYIESEIEARSRVRPDSLRPLSELPEGIIRRTNPHWVWYRTSSGMAERADDQPQTRAETQKYGKYLFFTPGETRVLESIVIEQFTTRPFNTAKVPSEPNRRDDAVLCLYYPDDRYTAVLRGEYQNESEDGTYGVASPFNADEPVIMPRGFKTDEATRQGEYSDRFNEQT